MPVRALAKPPGEFMRDHLLAAGGMDYPQAMYKAYKEHLKSAGLKDGCSRSSWSRYIWLANRIGLIEFDHAEAPAFWDGIVDGVEVTPSYERERRPQAPSPRHYYRILDPNDPRWIRLEASYRESIGFEVPPPAPRPTPKPPKEKKPAPKPKPKAKKKPSRKVKKVEAPTMTAEEKITPYEERIGLIIATLAELEATPTLALVSDIENQAVELGEDVVAAAKKAKGTERTLLSNISLRLRQTLEDMTLLRSSVQRLLASKTDAERAHNIPPLRAAIRVVRENISPLPPEERGEE